ncbi:hypothetical protein B0H14DRAFT_419199 [Mycena olivaceomarginata]|nr:hypothetical protein B0H14DRAFT_419199 [Mycena olivaceomarginata]
MSAPLTIAILGATGTLGPSLLQAIADHPKVLDARIRILTRPTSAEKAHTLAARYPTLYLTVHAVDYTGAKAETGLAVALRGVDVVLSAVGDDSGLTRKDVAHLGLLPGFIAQDAVACAAKAAGVKLFVPSEFGAPTHSMALNSESYIVGKRYHHDFLRKLELPYMLVYAGMFPEIEPAPAPLPQLSPEDPIPLGQPPFETSRYHVAAYIVQLLLDRGVEAVAGGIYVIRGLRRDHGAVSAETGKTEWILDV